VPRHRPVGDLGRPLADQDLRADELLGPPSGARPRHPQRPSGAQAGAQGTAQRAAALDVQGLVDGLVRGPHRLIMGEVDPQPVGDLFRAPRPGPAPVLAAAVPAPDPPHLRARHRRAVGRGDQAGKPVLHVHAQMRRPRWTARARSPSRTAADAHAAPPAAGQATASAAFLSPSQPNPVVVPSTPPVLRVLRRPVESAHLWPLPCEGSAGPTRPLSRPCVAPHHGSSTAAAAQGQVVLRPVS
jgi:hypothetical protein